MAMQGEAKHLRRYCRLEHKADAGRLHGNMFECTSCSNAERQLRRNLGQRPEAMQHWSMDEVATFFRELQKAKPDDGKGRMIWKTVRACLLTVVTRQQVQKWTAAVSGQYLPVSVYTTQGWEKETVEKAPREWNEDLECWTYRIAVKSVSYEETFSKVEENILRQEREAHKKKGKCLDPEEDVDVPQLDGKPKDESNPGKDKSHTKCLRHNEKLSGLAAKALGVFQKPLGQLEREEKKLLENTPAEVTDGTQQTLKALREKLDVFCRASRVTLENHEKSKHESPENVTQLRDLPFEAADFKALPKQVAAVLKALRTETSKKRAAQPVLEPPPACKAAAKSAPKAKAKGNKDPADKGKADQGVTQEPGKRRRTTGKQPED